MTFPAHFAIVEDCEDCLLLEDLGPWDKHLTITNDAERVVEAVASLLKGRRLEYIDSQGERSRLLVSERGTFAGFA